MEGQTEERSSIVEMQSEILFLGSRPTCRKEWRESGRVREEENSQAKANKWLNAMVLKSKG